MGGEGGRHAIDWLDKVGPNNANSIIKYINSKLQEESNPSEVDLKIFEGSSNPKG